jgi:hypothetical protein
MHASITVCSFKEYSVHATAFVQCMKVLTISISRSNPLSLLQGGCEILNQIRPRSTCRNCCTQHCACHKKAHLLSLRNVSIVKGSNWNLYWNPTASAHPFCRWNIQARGRRRIWSLGWTDGAWFNCWAITKYSSVHASIHSQYSSCVCFANRLRGP